MKDIEQSSFSFRAFYVRRIRRIFPALIVVLTVCWVAGWLILLPNDFAQVGKHIVAGSAFISNLASWSESGYFDTVAESNPLLNLWSLGIEEQFYFFWPSIVWLARGKKSILHLALCIAGGSFLINVIAVQLHYLTAAFYSPLTRFWELMAGCALAIPLLTGKLHMLNLQSKPSVRAWVYLIDNAGPYVGALLILSAIFLLRDKSFPGWWALLPVVGTCLLISADRRTWINRTILSSRLMVWIGLISYPLYLWHWPLLTYARIIEESPSPQTRAVLILISVFLAWLTYKFVERPFRFGSCRTIGVRILVPLISVIGIAGLLTYIGHGLAFRYPASTRSFAAFKYDFSRSYRLHDCFLATSDEEFKFNDCVEADDGRPLLLILGDSHAAHLYPGLRSKAPQFRIAQFTTSACPPILGYTSKQVPHCEANNSFALSQAILLRPSLVILAASWPSYGEQVSQFRLKKTIDKLRRNGLMHIIVVGPVPIWSKALPSLLYQKMTRTILGQAAPTRLSANGSYPIQNFRSAFEVDAEMSRYLADLQVTYVSPITILCNDSGCLTRADDALDSVMSWDTSHLTTRGSEYLIEHFPQSTLARR